MHTQFWVSQLYGHAKVTYRVGYIIIKQESGFKIYKAKNLLMKLLITNHLLQETMDWLLFAWSDLLTY